MRIPDRNGSTIHDRGNQGRRAVAPGLQAAQYMKEQSQTVGFLPHHFCLDEDVGSDPRFIQSVRGVGYRLDQTFVKA